MESRSALPEISNINKGNKGLKSYRLPLVLGLVIITGSVIALRPTRAQSGAANPYYVSTLAGIITGGYADGVGYSARFNGPLGIAVDKEDNVIVADYRNARIRKVSPAGVATTIAGAICWQARLAIDRHGHHIAGAPRIEI